MKIFTQKECVTDAKAQAEQLDTQYGDTLCTTLHQVLDERSQKIVEQVQINVLAKIRSNELDS